MNEAFTLPAALALDLMIGDPVTPWHPVRIVGRFARRIEERVISQQQGYLGGTIAFIGVVGSVISSAFLLLNLAGRIHPAVESGLGVLLVFISIAPRDLGAHALRVLRALEQGDLDAARHAVAAIVGRDTDILDESETCRAAVETVAESTVDGVIAPLFWACLLGPIGAIGYRTLNTLDSMWGHRDARYARFGTVAARADDVANFVPARLTLGWVAIAAWCLGMNAREAFRIGRRHGPRHASPNSGLTEAAFAGALEITLGGRNRYDGEWHDGPTFGDSPNRPSLNHLRKSLKLMWSVTFVGLITLTALRAALLLRSDR